MMNCIRINTNTYNKDQFDWNQRTLTQQCNSLLHMELNVLLMKHIRVRKVPEFIRSSPVFSCQPSQTNSNITEMEQKEKEKNQKKQFWQDAAR